MRLLDHTKIDFISAFFVFIVIIYAASASLFVRNYGDVRTIGCWLYVFVLLLFFIFNRVKINPKLFWALIVFLAYAFITSINNKVINAIWINKWIITILSAYSICFVFRNRFFVVFETLVFYLSIIALFFWLIHLVIPDYFIPFARSISFSKKLISSSELETINIIFYTINDEYHLSLNTRLFLRNAGFAWEPGAYAVFLCFAIFCNIIRTDFKLHKNVPLFVFLIALASTQSTTGFVVFASMYFTWLIIKRRYWLALLLIPVVIWINTLPFMGDKIITQQGTAQEFSLREIDSRYTYNVNRFVAFDIYFEEYLRHPILGLGGYDDGTWLRKNGYDNIALASGIGQMIAMYGSIMTLLYFVLLFRTIMKIKREISEYGILLLFPVVGLLFSYVIWLHPLFITFAFWGYFTGKSVIINKNTGK